MDDPTTVLGRPVGRAELELVRESGFAAFPPRLPFQPILYPVLERAYAEQIARSWNTTDPASGFEGAVLAFAVRVEYLSRYPVRTAGGRTRREYCIQAEDLPAFNRNIVGLIEVIARFTSGRGA